jgi:hypothetical protein
LHIVQTNEEESQAANQIIMENLRNKVAANKSLFTFLCSNIPLSSAYGVSIDMQEHVMRM